jgi:hypothetical protein
VLLKLGGYGILRVRRIFNIDYLITQLLRISLLGGGLLSVLCLT